MLTHKSLRRFWLVALAALLAGGMVQAKTKKADKLLKDGQAAEQRMDYDKALDLYVQAVNLDPTDPTYQIPVRRVRFQAAQKHVDNGVSARSQGNLDVALAEFEKAVSIDPSSAIGAQELKRTQEMVEREKKNPSKPQERGLTPVEQAQKQSEERIASMLPIPALKPKINAIPPIHMNNQPPKVLYETVGKIAGINVLYDPQQTQQPRPMNVDMGASTLEQALDYLATVTHTFWKPLSENAIFVTEDSVNKRRDYEDEVVRVFYVRNTTSIQEFQELAGAIRGIIEMRRYFMYNAQRAILVRGTADQVALVEKLVNDLDKPKSEVIIDIIVMEANRQKVKNLTLGLISGGSQGINFPVNFTPRNPILSGTTGGTSGGGTTGGGTTGGGTTGSSAISLAQLGRVSSNDFSTTLPGALLDALLTDTSAKVMQTPRVRASDGAKAVLKIGNKIPYASGSFQPGAVGTVGINPLVQTQFQFIETGVNVEITPQVLGLREVSMHIDVTLSNVTSRIDLGGISEPIVSQRSNNADIRLRDGEVNLLTGLTDYEDSRTLNGVPGLINIPILGRLFGASETSEKDRNELLIAIIPHIVRTPGYTPENLREIYAGNDQNVKINYASKETPATASGPGAAPEQPVAVVTPATEAPKPATPPAAPAVSFMPVSLQAQVGAPLTVLLQAQNLTDLFSAAPIRIKWDPKLLRMNDIVAGDLMTRDGQRVTTAKDIRNDSGEAWITISRLPGAGGIGGSGTLLTLTFVAAGQGSGQLTIEEMSLKNGQLQPIALLAPTLAVNIQ